MKISNFPPLSLILIIALALFTACSKDIETDDTTDNLIGIWQVVDGEAEAFEQGEKLGSLEVATSGTFEFRLDGTGAANFTMMIEGEEYSILGSFIWDDLGNELLVRSNGDSQIWKQIADQRDFQTLQFTQNSNDLEITITLNLTK